MHSNRVDEFFQVSQRRTTLRTEVLAGLSTFLALSYIVVVNPAILSQAGVPHQAAFFATVVVSGAATILMGTCARLPFAVAPGMEMNAYVAYFVVSGLGLGWQAALGTVFWSGVAFVALSISGLRHKILISLPDHLKTGLALSVGVFVAVVGLRIAGVLHFDANHFAGVGPIASAEMLVMLVGLATVWWLTAVRMPGAAIVSVAVAALLARRLIPSEPNAILPLSFHEMMRGVGALDLSVITKPRAWTAILILLLVDFYGSLAKLIGLTRGTCIADSRDGVPRLRTALVVDSASTVIGALLGTSNLTVFVESGVGIAAGGRTGIVALVCGSCLLLCLALAPLLRFVPLVATSGLLVYVAVQLCPRREDMATLPRSELLGLLAMVGTVVVTFAIDRAFLIGLLVYMLSAWRSRHVVSPYVIGSAALLTVSWILQ